MDPDITINVNLTPTAATTAEGSAITVASDAVGPSPMSLGELLQAGGGSVDVAPAPVSLGDAQAAVSATATDEPPAPMSIGLLGGAIQPEAPMPEQLDALAGASATAPAPSVEMLSAAGFDDAPAPMEIEDLNSEDGKSGKKK